MGSGRLYLVPWHARDALYQIQFAKDILMFDSTLEYY